VLTVLDFVGHQRTDFRFDQRFRKLLGGTRPEVEKQIEADFPFLPAGCAISSNGFDRNGSAYKPQLFETKASGWVWLRFG